jgi:hypothetical protein
MINNTMKIEYHNPDNLTDEQIETHLGYRLLTKEENRIGCTIPNDLQMWLLHNGWSCAQLCSGTGTSLTYRTKLPLPLQEQSKDPEKLGMWKFIRACKVAVFPNPFQGDCPFGSIPNVLTFVYGRCEGVGEINESGEFDDYNGETHKLKTPLVIVP